MRNILILFLAVVAVVSCKSEPDPDIKEPSINFIGSYLEIPSVAKTINFTVRAYKVNWKLHMSDNTWCGTPSITNSDTTKVIYLDVSANTSSDKRNMYAIIEYTLDGEDKKDSLNIEQLGEHLQLNLTEDYLEIDNNGGDLTVGLASNLPWRVTEAPNWLDVVDYPLTRALDTIDIRIKVEPNTSYSYRLGEVLFAQEGDTIYNKLKVYQYGIGSLKKDSLALVDLYNSTGGTSWTKTWDLTTPVASWYGIKVGKTIEGMRVTSLVMPNNNLEGTLPSSFANLSYVVDLWLNDNKLTGNLPSNIGDMQNLSYCYLYNNNFTGSIPESFGMATKMFRLYLQKNSFTGTIPATIGNMTSLDGLGLDNNNLTGGIPEEIGALKKLRVLSLHNNRLNGAIPDTYLKNNYWETWNPKDNICPQQSGYGFTNCTYDEF